MVWLYVPGLGDSTLVCPSRAPVTAPVCFVEGEAYAAATLARRMEDHLIEPAPIWSDVKTFDGRPWRGVVDIVTAGYPCQPFSLAGKRLGEKDPRHLWPDIRRVIEETAPSLVFCENVSAHLRKGFNTVCKDMGALGYTVAAGVFTAWAVGAPHIRERLFWLACTDAECFRGDRLRERGRGVEANIEHDGEEGAVADSDGGGQQEVGGCGVFDEKREAFRDDVDRCCSAWGSEPSVGRVADGVAHRVDRLRATGNGVVPAMAAKAFTTLVQELIP